MDLLRPVVEKVLVEHVPEPAGTSAIREPGVGVTAPQTRQDHQRLPARVQPPPPRPGLPAAHQHRVPYRGRRENLSAGQKAVNRAHAKTRTFGERAMATLKNWPLLHKPRSSTTRTTSTAQANLTLNLTRTT